MVLHFTGMTDKPKTAKDIKQKRSTDTEKSVETPEEKVDRLMRYTPKMQTYQQRRIEIRVPDTETAERWKERAKESKMSLSKFIIEHVENSINLEGKDGQPSRGELVLENRMLKERLEHATREQRTREKLVKELNDFIETLKADNPFYSKNEKDPEFLKMVTSKMKDSSFIRSKDVFKVIEIEPTDTRNIKLINFQLDFFEDCGLLDKIANGWKVRY